MRGAHRVSVGDSCIDSRLRDVGRVFGGLTLAVAALLASASLASCGGKKGDGGGASDTTIAATPTTNKPQAFSGKAHVVGTLNQLYGVRVSLEPIAAPFT